MYLFTTEQGLSDYLKGVPRDNIGFVPTMGALHEGHRSLVKRSQKKNHHTVVSIFVNPTQFNNPGDLEKYPRTMEADINFLMESGCDVLFCPGEDEIYKPGKAKVPEVPLKRLGHTLEAEFRPGHFEGVMQVVARLLEIVKPAKMFMGQKDLQQVVVLKRMIDQLNIPVRLVSCPTIREEDGLARSSRNRLIPEELRPKVNILYKSLQYCSDHFLLKSINELKAEISERFDRSPFRLEYFEFLKAEDLSILEEKDSSVNIVAAMAAWAGNVRLIDNLMMQGNL